jgi:hypothetical protein
MLPRFHKTGACVLLSALSCLRAVSLTQTPSPAEVIALAHVRVVDGSQIARLTVAETEVQE